jgi:hypothetical protein
VGHTGHTGLWLNALLKALEDLNHGVADLIDLIALPRNREQNLSPPASTGPSGDVQPDMPPMIQHRPAPAAAPLR